jgi:hypothetical protein
VDEDKSAKYAEEQDNLARRLEEGGAEDIQIRAPKDPEVRPEVYKDVEPLLFRGFLTISAQINEINFVFKSLNQHEMDLLRFMMPDNKASASSDFWNLFLAHGVFMVNGVNVLPERERHIQKIAGTFRDMPVAVRNKIVWHLGEINRRASNAVILTECYATERYSRYKWYQLQGLDMTTTAVSGIQGTDRLGLNWAQLIWRALNKIEDINDLQEQSWEHAKFVGSCSAGKGISKVYQQDNDRRTKAKAEQFARKDKLLRQVLSGEKSDERVEQGGAVMVTARTVEDLAAQLEADLRGEKDWHDQVVDAYQKKANDAYKQRRQQLEDMAKSREQEFGGKALFGGTEMKGFTPAEVHERLLRQRQIEAQGAAAQMVWPEMYDEKLQNVMGRYESEQEGAKVTPTDRDTSDVMPLPSIVRRGTPFKR